jgi:hypothetical protein
MCISALLTKADRSCARVAGVEGRRSSSRRKTADVWRWRWLRRSSRAWDADVPDQVSEAVERIAAPDLRRRCDREAARLGSRSARWGLTVTSGKQPAHLRTSRPTPRSICESHICCVRVVSSESSGDWQRSRRSAYSGMLTVISAWESAARSAASTAAKKRL